MCDLEKLYDKLIKYSQSAAYPFHMPGHKRQMMTMEDPYRFDLTEIDGFDNLHEAEDLLKGEQERAARLYGAEESHFVVNGSTGGILAAMAGVFHRNDRVLVARNCHKSVYHGIELNGLRPVYLWPEQEAGLGIYKGIQRESAEQMLDLYPDIRAVIFTSPTYEGLLSDVAGICEAAHKRNIPCIVDEAHGAHLRWAGLPDSVSQGADVVIQSLHKTMPALTQTALVHLNGDRISKANIRRMLAVYQTSSPSYVLMASISQCLNWIEREGQSAFSDYKQRVQTFRKEMEALEHLQVYSPEGHYDWGKLVISVDGLNMSGRQLYDELRDQYRLQMEMVSDAYVLAMSTVADSPIGFRRLSEALKEIDWYYQLDQMGQALLDMERPPHRRDVAEVSFQVQEETVRSMEIHEARDMATDWICLETAAGRSAGEYVYLYPPGIPLLVPGEVIQMKHIERIRRYTACGLAVHGGYSENQINVIC